MRRINKNLLYPKLSYKLTGILFDIHNGLRRFCKERQYQDAFEKKLREYKINYEREKMIPNSGNQTDFCIENKILIEFKMKDFLTKENYFQIKRYLESSRLKLGFLVNFRSRYLKPKRVINLDNIRKFGSIRRLESVDYGKKNTKKHTQIYQKRKSPNSSGNFGFEKTRRINYGNVSKNKK